MSHVVTFPDKPAAPTVSIPGPIASRWEVVASYGEVGPLSVVLAAARRGVGPDPRRGYRHCAHHHRDRREPTGLTPTAERLRTSPARPSCAPSSTPRLSSSLSRRRADDGAACMRSGHEKAGLSPRSRLAIVAQSKVQPHVGRADDRHHEAAGKHGSHRVGEELQHRFVLLRLAAVAAGGPAVLFYGEVLLLGVALCCRTHRTGRGGCGRSEPPNGVANEPVVSTS